jgi:colanic acid biosynthesis glycosyl transferase WcaI
MKVLLSTQVYPPELQATAQMVRELAQDLSARGHQVTVLTGFPHHNRGRLYEGYARRLRLTEQEGPVRVVRAWHMVSPSSAFSSRALVMLSQAVGQLLAGLLEEGHQAVVSFGPPLAGPLTASALARRNGAALLTVIYDIYPDIAVEMGALRSRALIKALSSLEQLTYRASDRLVVLSEGLRQRLLQKGVPREKTEVLPVWLSQEEIQPQGRINAWRQRMGIAPEMFVVLHAGTIGLVSGAQVLLQAASLLRRFGDMLFLFVGEGRLKPLLQRMAQEAGLGNVRFLPFQPRQWLSQMQACADVSVLTLLAGRGQTSWPSKLLAYMAAQRPVVASVDADCDTARTILASGSGLVVPPGQPQALAQAILRLYRDAPLREEMGRRGRQYFLEHFERRKATARFAALIEELSRKR